MLTRIVAFLILMSILLSSCSSAGSHKSSTATLPITAGTEEVSLDDFVYAIPGKHFSGKMRAKYPHPWLKDHTLDLTIFYPAYRPQDFTGIVSWDAEPDFSEAPYTTLFCSSTIANEFAPLLVSHGLVVVSVNGQGPYNIIDSKIVDYPQEILASLDFVATDPPAQLKEMMQTDRVGVFGYSFDGYNSLALSGARFDPLNHAEKCADLLARPDSVNPKPVSWWLPYMCPKDLDYIKIIGDARDRLSVEEDGLWEPMTDMRIQAAAPMAPDGALWFGEKGLKYVRIPVLLIAGTEDTMSPYNLESVPIFGFIGSPDKTLISFIGRDHMKMLDSKEKAMITHFLVAFFKHHLENSEADAFYYSSQFVNNQSTLYYGVYEEE